MTNSRAEGNSETKPGPANPAVEGVDAPSPPGGPQRQDAPAEGRDAERFVPQDDETTGGTIPIEDEQPDPDQIDVAKSDEELQAENAGTSLDEPSEDVT